MTNKYLKFTHVSEPKFRQVLRLFCNDIPALTTARLIGLNKNTTHALYSKIRSRVVEMASQESERFTGEIEVDESYFGAKRIRGKRGRGAKGKIPVVGLLKRDGKVYTQMITKCTREELLPVIKGRVLENSTVYTDGWRSYAGLIVSGYRHKRIHHQRDEFARGKNHINGIESFWGYTKTRMVKLRGIRKTRFLVHLKESEWRWNHKRENTYKQLLKELRIRPLI